MIFKLILSIAGSFIIAYLSMSLFPNIDIKSMLDFYLSVIIFSMTITIFLGLPLHLITFGASFYYWYLTGSFGAAASFLLFTIVMGIIQLIITNLLNWVDYRIIRY